MKFMNLDKWLYSNPQDKENGGENGGGGGGENEPFKAFATQEELDAYIAEQAKPNDDEISIAEKRKQQDEKRQQDAQKTEKIQLAVIFDNQFDSVIEKNKELFPESVGTIRNDVVSSDVVEKAGLIAATAAKEYFSIEQNLESLTKADRDRVEKEILNVRFESQIDGLKAWELVERSIHGHELANMYKKANDFTGKGGTGDTGYKNVDKYLKGFFPEGVHSVPA